MRQDSDRVNWSRKRITGILIILTRTTYKIKSLNVRNVNRTFFLKWNEGHKILKTNDFWESLYSYCIKELIPSKEGKFLMVHHIQSQCQMEFKASSEALHVRRMTKNEIPQFDGWIVSSNSASYYGLVLLINSLFILLKIVSSFLSQFF